MTRQVYGFNPATGRVEHHYRDCGPGRVDSRGAMHMHPIVPRGAENGADNYGRKRGTA